MFSLRKYSACFTVKVCDTLRAKHTTRLRFERYGNVDDRVKFINLLSAVKILMKNADSQY